MLVMLPSLTLFTNNWKVPDSLITPGKSIAPPFTFGSSPLSKSVEDKQKAKPHTKGVAIPKRTPANGTSSSRLSTYGSAFSFLNDDVSPSSAMKKRPLPAKIGEKNEKQERGPTVKKIRTEDSLASKLAKTLSVRFSTITSQHEGYTDNIIASRIR